MKQRKTDTQDVDAIIEANRNEMSDAWAREFADPDSYWHKLAVGIVTIHATAEAIPKGVGAYRMTILDQVKS
jgi:hypothetical protein